MTSQTAPDPLAKSQLMPLLYAMYAAPVLLVVPLYFTLGVPEGDTPVLAVVVIALWLAGAFLVAETFGYKSAALSPDLESTEAARLAGQRFRSTLMLRLGITESPVIASPACAFVVNNLWVYVFGVVLGLPMMIFVTWPSARTIGKVRDQLEADGARSYLLA